MKYIDYIEQNMVYLLDDLKNPIFSSINMIKDIKTDNTQINDTLKRIKNELSGTFNQFHNFKYYYYYKNKNQSFEGNTNINSEDLIDEMHEYDKSNQKNITYKKYDSFPDKFKFKQNVLIRMISNLKKYVLKDSNQCNIEFKHVKDVDNNLINDKENEFNDMDKESLLAIQITNNGHEKDSVIQNENKNYIQIESDESVNKSKYILLKPNQNLDVNLNLCAMISYLINVKVFYNPQNKDAFLVFQPEYYEESKSDSKELKIKSNIENINHKNQELINDFEHKCNAMILVEDTEHVMKMYIKMCNKKGINYVDFYDGTEAKEYISKLFMSNCKNCRKELLILSDQVMPYMNGTILHEWLLEQNKIYNYKINFILVTANEDTYEGIDNVIFKPLTIKKMTQIRDKYYIE